MSAVERLVLKLGRVYVGPHMSVDAKGRPYKKSGYWRRGSSASTARPSGVPEATPKTERWKSPPLTKPSEDPIEWEQQSDDFMLDTDMAETRLRKLFSKQSLKPSAFAVLQMFSRAPSDRSGATSYKDVNDHYRYGTGGSVMAVMGKNLRQGFEANKTTKSLTLHRTAHLPQLANVRDPSELVGTTIEDKGVTATSFSETVSAMAMVNEWTSTGEDGMPTTIEIEAPAGTHALYNGESAVAEVDLAPDTKLEVLEAEWRTPEWLEIMDEPPERVLHLKTRIAG